MLDAALLRKEKNREQNQEHWREGVEIQNKMVGMASLRMCYLCSHDVIWARTL